MRKILWPILGFLFFVAAPQWATAQTAQTLRVIADRTTVRDKPTTDGTIVTALSKGDELEVIDRSGTWYHVRVKPGGAEGYVNQLVVEVAQNGSVPANGGPNRPPPPPPPPLPPPPPTGGTGRVGSGGSTSPPATTRNYFI